MKDDRSKLFSGMILDRFKERVPAMETLNLFREIYRKFTGRRGRPSRDDLAAAFRFR